MLDIIHNKMENTYEIKYEPVKTDDIKDKDGKIIQKGVNKEAYNIYYYENGLPATSVPWKEYHSKDGINGTIRSGFTLKQ